MCSIVNEWRTSCAKLLNVFTISRHERISSEREWWLSLLYLLCRKDSGTFHDIDRQCRGVWPPEISPQFC
jgi:hypothetical protein